MTPKTLNLAEQLFVAICAQINLSDGNDQRAEVAANQAMEAAEAYERVARFRDCGGRRNHSTLESDIDFYERLKRWEKDQTGRDISAKATNPENLKECLQCKDWLPPEWPSMLCYICEPDRARRSLTRRILLSNAEAGGNQE